MISITLLILLLANAVIAQTVDNPLKDKLFYVNPTYQRKVDNTISKLAPGGPDYEKTLQNLKLARESSTVIWLNSNEQVSPNSTKPESMNSVLKDAARNPGTIVFFSINNIPKGKCTEKLPSYKSVFINNIVSFVSKYKYSVSMAFIIEPNAVGSMVTDINKPVCQDAETQQNVWREAVSYAVTELNRNAPEVPLYVGLGHGGWLGSEKNSQGAADVVISWDIEDKIRGFATNIGNYQPVGKACPEPLYCVPGQNHESDVCCSSACEVKADFHDNNEMNYALRMEAFFPGKKFVIDTGRSGVSNARSSCDNWCNIRDAGLGLLPSADTSSPIVDAYLWIKPPGETSGCTQTLPTGGTCKSFTPSCASVDSIGSRSGEPRMPEGGQWSDYFITMLARNANYDNVVIRRPPIIRNDERPAFQPTPPPSTIPKQKKNILTNLLNVLL